MKVVHLINGLGRGGGERLLVRLVAGLDRSRVSVYCLTRRGPLADDLVALGVPVRELTYRCLPVVWNIVRLAKALWQADVLHTHFFYSDLVGSVLGRVLRVPLRFATRHETGYWMTRAHRALEPWIYRGFHRVICVSQAVREAM
ncbi:MAG: glycosyltransferase, partial [Deltaproteobacteria bacterium]|nr:glycosyltransferase [Deltaproteobacteria bacterium]